MANTTVVTADYGTVVVAKGSAKIAACILNGTKLNITHAAVGDGGGQYSGAGDGGGRIGFAG